jgi:MFS family permease
MSAPFDASPEAMKEPRLAGAWAPLGRPVFRALWIAGLASNLGTWIQNVGAAWLMMSLAPEPLIVSLVQVASSLPFFLLAIPAGALADVVDRRRLALVALGWLAAAAALLGALTLAGWAGPTTLLAFTFALGVGSALLGPTLAAIFPELVAREEIEPAVSLNSISMNVARAAGPALGGVVVAAAGAGATFALNAASFVAVMVVLYRWQRPEPERKLPPEELFGAMRAGVRYVRHSPPLRAVLVRTGSFVLPASAVWALLPLYARDTLGLGPAGYGLLLGFFGIGAVASGVALPRIRARLGVERLATFAALVFALSQLALDAFQALAPVAVALAVAGGAWLTLLSTLTTAAQMTIPSWVRARALATHMLVLFGGLAAGSAAWGVLAGIVGVPHSFGLSALAIALGRALTWRRRLPADTKLDLAPAPIWPDPAVLRPFETDRGPALVTIEYQIDPADSDGFARAMRELGAIRLRDGAIRWGLWDDVAEPGQFLESFVVESWLEHLRQHERVTAADRAVQAIAHAYHRGGNPPRVRHFVHGRIPKD